MPPSNSLVICSKVTIKENRCRRQPSGMKKKAINSRKMEIYESVFEEGKSNRKQSLKERFDKKIKSVRKKTYRNIRKVRSLKPFKQARKSNAGTELDWSNSSNLSGVKTLVSDFGRGKFSMLTRLYLSGCGLSRLPDDFEILPLETLSLESNKFKEFPGSLTKMKTLKCLYLRYIQNVTF